MPTIGHIENFDPSTSGDFRLWAERLNSYFEVNSVAKEKQVCALISLLGGQTYALLRNLTSPENPKSKSYAELIKLLSDHLAPKPILIAERYRFRKRTQKENESLMSFLAELRRLAEHCEFTSLDDSLRDQFVLGLGNDLIKNRLLTISNLTLKKAVEIAVSMDTAARDVGEFSCTPRADTNVHKVKARVQNQRAPAPRTTPNPNDICRRCNQGGHRADDCRFRNVKCHGCGLVGHIQKACRRSSLAKPTETRFRGEWKRNAPNSYKPAGRNAPNSYKPVKAVEPDNLDLCTLGIYDVKSPGHRPFTVDVKCQGSPTTMEVDTGAAVSIMSEDDFHHLSNASPDPIPLTSTSIQFKTYTGEKFSPVGMAMIHVEYGPQKMRLPLYVVKRAGPPLMGREWLHHIRLDWKQINHIGNREDPPKMEDSHAKLQGLLKKYPKLFDQEAGAIRGIKAKLCIKPGSNPKFVKARPLPFALRKPVEDELEEKVKAGILTPVEVSDWATPIVPILKSDGKVRICGDYKVTVNPVLEAEHYPIPRPEELFAKLAGCHFFSKLDLTQAYQQMEVQEDSQEYLTISTHKGLYRQNRLPFGISTAPAIFQRSLEQILQGLNHVQNSLDDILVGGSTIDSHLQNLEAVLSRLNERGIKLHPTKCKFMVTELEYLGHIINREGIRTTDEKVQAIKNAPPPTDVTQLRSFLGLVNYYHKFLPNLASILHPLHKLLRKEQRWCWTPEQESSYEKVKELIITSRSLTHFDSNLPLLLATDASPYGVGAVLSHRFPDGSERAISFASRTLTTCEKNYSQIDKEALAIVFALQKFHQYLYAQHFTILTDNQPLAAILSPKKGIPTLSAARLQRWAIFLSAHHYEIEYRPSAKHANADAMSRVPLPTTRPVASELEIDSVDVVYTNYLSTLPVDARTIARETSKDRTLNKVLYLLSTRWNTNDDPVLAKFFTRRHEMSVHQGCIVWGLRVVIPHSLQPSIIEELHRAHPGIVRMKALARSYVWWPLIDSAIEDAAKGCHECRENQKTPVSSPLHPWAWPEGPWERIHADFAGPIDGKMILVIIDAHSKWPEVFAMTSTTTSETIKCFQTCFARYGLPYQVVTDNGPQFSSVEFGDFLKHHGIRRTLVAPYHPSSNGRAERFVQLLKHALRKGKDANLHERITEFLCVYRTTPHASTQAPPANLFLKRNPRTRLDLIRPAVRETVKQQQFK